MLCFASICCSGGTPDDLLADEHDEYMIQREDGDGTDEPGMLDPVLGDGEGEACESVNCMSALCDGLLGCVRVHDD